MLGSEWEAAVKTVYVIGLQFGRVRTCVVGTMFSLYNMFYGRPPNFHNGLINLFCILYPCAALASMSDC